MAASRRYRIRTHDVRTAYLHGILDRTVYMQQPDGFQKGTEGGVCKLLKSLYGLPQSGRCWFLKLRQVLLSAGLNQSYSDPCVFFKRDGEDLLALTSHVDDLLEIGPDKMWEEVYHVIKKQIDIVEVKHDVYLGIGLKIIPEGIFLHQTNYVDKLLDRYGMKACKFVKTPALAVQTLDSYDDSPKCDKEKYQELLGSLLYLVSGTRVDIAFAVTNLARFSQEPREMHWEALKRIVRYLAGTKNNGLLFPWGKQESLTAATDASWSVTHDAKGFSGYLVRAARCLLSWKVQKQKLVAMSSAESELLALVEGVRELIWIRGLLSEMGSKQVEYPIKLYTDSQAVINMVNNLGISPRTKHYNRKLWFVRDEVVDKHNVILIFTKSEELEVDMLTKPLGNTLFQKHVNKLNLIGNT